MEKIALEKLKKILAEIPSVKLAYLIGSEAEKRTRKESDLDVVLVTDPEKLADFDYGSAFLAVSQAISHPNLDLRVVALGKTDSLFLFNVVKGKLLYAKSEEDRVIFEAKTMTNYYDSQYLRNTFHYYISQRLERGVYGC